MSRIIVNSPDRLEVTAHKFKLLERIDQIVAHTQLYQFEFEKV